MVSPGRRIGYRRNLALAKRLWYGQINREQQFSLKSLSENYGLSVAAGDLQLLENRWYVTHSGLIHLASRRKCRGIKTFLQERLSDPAANRWVFRAVVYKGPNSKGFAGYGDANPGNVGFTVQGAEMRIAETRAVNRALRKAYGIGLCSVEELGAFSSAPRSSSIVPSVVEWVSSFQRFGQRPAPAPGSALPFNPPIQPRFESGKGLRSGLLRHRSPQRRQPRIGRVLYLPPLCGCQREPRCSGLQTEFLRSTSVEAQIMRRHIPGSAFGTAGSGQQPGRNLLGSGRKGILSLASSETLFRTPLQHPGANLS